jgi:hypothetical protein
MKRINEMREVGASFSSSSSFFRLRRSPSRGARLACEADLEHKAKVTTDRTSENSVESPSSTSGGRSVGVVEYSAARNFCGLSLELSARTVINNETVLPKAAETAGIMKPRLSLGVVSEASPRRAATKPLERRVVSKQ